MRSTVLSDASYRMPGLMDGACADHTLTMAAHTRALETASSTTSGVTSAGVVTEHAKAHAAHVLGEQVKDLHIKARMKP